MPIIASLCLYSLVALQKSAPLGIGDKAPALALGATIKGSPPKALGKGRVAVVEFWATWCGPCIQMMPHLSEVYTTYRGSVDFVGVSVMESDWSKVAPFVEKMGDKIAYPIALDKPAGTMAKTWLDASGQNAIPRTFIVGKEGRIEWVGHPQDMETPLKQVVAGTWDALAYKKKFDLSVLNSKEEDALIRDFYGVLSGAATEGRSAEVLAWIAKESPRFKGTSVPAALAYTKQLFTALSAKDYAEALKLIDTPIQNSVVFSYYRPFLLQAKIAVLQGQGDTAGWKKVAGDAIDGPPDPNILIMLANCITSSKCKLPDRDPAIALRAAEKLCSMSRNPAFLLSLVWARYHNGEKETAIKLLEEAYSKLEAEKKRNPAFAPELKKDLDAAAKAIKGL